jgi:hypothetical protein|tara:strand:+ start:131 stop:718 length:588 start_codon:yes stop_codon:yes gene_type:complete
MTEKFSERVLKIKKLIENKEYKIKELQNYYNNISNSKEISDYEREFLIDAVEKKIRVKFPNKAKKILGGKSAKAQELLEEVYKSLTREFDWSKNNVGNKVKVGGSMISGKEYVCWYISYKNDNGYSTGLHYRQIKPEDDPCLEVDFRKVGKDFEKDREIKIFPVQLKDEAVTLYKTYLAKTIGNIAIKDVEQTNI